MTCRWRYCTMSSLVIIKVCRPLAQCAGFRGIEKNVEKIDFSLTCLLSVATTCCSQHFCRKKCAWTILHNGLTEWSMILIFLADHLRALTWLFFTREPELSPINAVVTTALRNLTDQSQWNKKWNLCWFCANQHQALCTALFKPTHRVADMVSLSSLFRYLSFCRLSEGLKKTIACFFCVISAESLYSTARILMRPLRVCEFFSACSPVWASMLFLFISFLAAEVPVWICNICMRVRLCFFVCSCVSRGKQTSRLPVRFQCTAEHASFNGEVLTRTQTSWLIREEFSWAVQPRTGTLGRASGFVCPTSMELREGAQNCSWCCLFWRSASFAWAGWSVWPTLLIMWGVQFTSCMVCVFIQGKSRPRNRRKDWGPN